MFVLTSLSESLGVVYLEAMATKTPVVGTDVLGVSEVIVDGVTGFLVPAKLPDVLAEKITLLLSDKDRSKDFGENARKIVENKFSLRLQAESLIKMWSTKIDH